MRIHSYITCRTSISNSMIFTKPARKLYTTDFIVIDTSQRSLIVLIYTYPISYQSATSQILFLLLSHCVTFSSCFILLFLIYFSIAEYHMDVRKYHYVMFLLSTVLFLATKKSHINENFLYKKTTLKKILKSGFEGYNIIRQYYS